MARIFFKTQAEEFRKRYIELHKLYFIKKVKEKIEEAVKNGELFFNYTHSVPSLVGHLSKEHSNYSILSPLFEAAHNDRSNNTLNKESRFPKWFFDLMIPELKKEEILKDLDFIVKEVETSDDYYVYLKIFWE